MADAWRQGLNKPYDERYLTAMEQVAGDMLDEFHPTLVYTQSDELTLVFPKQHVNDRGNTSECIYNGHIQKVRTGSETTRK
mgnify:CR=1 FL=1